MGVNRVKFGENNFSGILESRAESARSPVWGRGGVQEDQKNKRKSADILQKILRDDPPLKIGGCPVIGFQLFAKQPFWE